MAAPLLVMLLGRIDAPGIDLDGLRGTGANFGIFALGVTPALSAYLVVEVLALVIPRWRKMRFAGPEGRAPLERAARIVTALFAISQAAGVAMSLLALPDGAPVRGQLGLVAMGATWVAGAMFLFYVAHLITRYGCVNGFIWLTMTSTAPDVARSLWSLRLAPGSPALQLSLAAVAVLVALVATWAVLPGRAPRTSRSPGGVVWLPVLVSSAVPIRIASNLMAYLANGDSAMTLHGKARLDLVVGYALAALLTVGFAWVFQPARRVVEIVTRAAGGGDARGLEEVAIRERRRGVLLSLLFFAALFLARNAVLSLPSGAVIDMETVALIAAALLDAVTTLRAYLAHPDAVVVWEDLRPHVVPPILGALEEAGIRADTRGLAPNVLFRFFAPFAPVQILVPRADAPRAAELVRERLVGETSAAAAPVATPTVAAATESTGPVPLVFRLAALSGALVLAMGTFFFAQIVRHRDDPPPGPPVSLLVVRVADDLNPFVDVTDDELPPGVSVSTELAPLGKEPVQRAFARIVPQPGESFADAESRTRAWLSKFPLPPRHMFAFEDVADYDEATGTSSPVAIRTFVIETDPILTETDVVEADAALEREQNYVYVAITLGKDGAQRFADATKQNIGRRLAIVVDGKIESAPVVRDAITGGRISLTMGSGAIDDQMRQAKQIAASLRAHPR